MHYLALWHSLKQHIKAGMVGARCGGTIGAQWSLVAVLCCKRRLDGQVRATNQLHAQVPALSLSAQQVESQARAAVGEVGLTWGMWECELEEKQHRGGSASST